MTFHPVYTITPGLANALMRIEAARQSVQGLPINSAVLASLRETARLYSTHYSTMIEGNRLTQEQVAQLIEHQEHVAGRERDEREVLGYYIALEKVEQWAAANIVITETHIRTLHALVMAGGRKRAKPTAYRDGQNVIRDSKSGSIVYLPPEAKDVSRLMKELVAWIKKSVHDNLPCPLRAAIAHYQYATIHPYYDGNGRTARLLTTLILHLGGYDLKGLYSLEEYYARDLMAYYDALTIGPSHNYYFGRAEADITKWMEYFCNGMVDSFEKVKQRALQAANTEAKDKSPWLRKLNQRQRRALELFHHHDIITSADIEKLFACSPRTARHLCAVWVREGFLQVANHAKKTRSYSLVDEYRKNLEV